MKISAAALLTATLAFASINTIASVPAAAEEGDSLKIVVTIFPEYDWVREILGDLAEENELILLLDSNVDMHSYQPTAVDIMNISTSDLFVYVGGESDKWVEDTLREVVNKDQVVVNLLESLGDAVKAEEVVEGMEHEHDHEHEHAEIEEEDIQDRSLEEFAGEWKSLQPLLESGALDEYVEHHAEEHGEPQDEVKEELAAKWACSAQNITVEGNVISFTDAEGNTVSAEYAYAGFTPVLAEDGDITGVRYQFETDSDQAPKYVQFNDHGYAPAEEVEHFHIYFGDESFEALSESETNPFFVQAALSDEEVLEELMGGHGHEEEEELDEHVWLSLKNASALVNVLCGALTELDPENTDTYSANAAAYTDKLNALDAEYTAALADTETDTLLFADRFPFRYLTEDYGLNYYAAFSGCSAETEASFETVVFLAQKLDELGLKHVMVIETSDGRLADTVIRSTQDTERDVLTLNSVQSVTASDIESGVTYYGIMQENLEVLKKALN